jgi:hypothetical protein
MSIAIPDTQSLAIAGHTAVRIASKGSSTSQIIARSVVYSIPVSFGGISSISIAPALAKSAEQAL